MGFFKVFRIEFECRPQTNSAIFLETADDGSGTLYRVIGAIEATGMVYNTVDCPKAPEHIFSNFFRSSYRLGDIKPEQRPRFEEIVESIPVPVKQFKTASQHGPIRHKGTRPRRSRDWANEVLAKVADDNMYDAGE